MDDGSTLAEQAVQARPDLPVRPHAWSVPGPPPVFSG
jgi:hypothetical protein